MTRYSIPCWLDIQHNFFLEVESDTPTNALLECHKLVDSLDEDDIAYVEACVAAGEADVRGAPVDFTDDISQVEEIPDNE